MDAVEVLTRPGKLRAVVEQYQQQLRELRRSPLNGYGYKERVQQSRNIHKMDDLMVKIEKLETACAEYGDQYLDAVDQFNRYVFQLSSLVQQNILFERYMFGRTYRQAAYKLGYAEQYLRAVHGKAIKALQEILDKEKCCTDSEKAIQQQLTV